MERRRVLSVLAGALGAALGAMLSAPLVGQVLSPLRRRRDGQGAFLPIGRVEDFPPGPPRRVTFGVTRTDGWTQVTEDQAAWVVRAPDGSRRVLSGTCPHLGCSVGRSASGDAFACPCHESEFAPDGAYRRGPARRGLDELPTREVAGELQVRWVEYVAGIAERRAVDA